MSGKAFRPTIVLNGDLLPELEAEFEQTYRTSPKRGTRAKEMLLLGYMFMKHEPQAANTLLAMARFTRFTAQNFRNELFNAFQLAGRVNRQSSIPEVSASTDCNGQIRFKRHGNTCVSV